MGGEIHPEGDSDGWSGRGRARHMKLFVRPQVCVDEDKEYLSAPPKFTLVNAKEYFELIVVHEAWHTIPWKQHAE